MKKRFQILAPSLLALLLALSSSAAIRAAGDPAPDFSYSDLKGSPHTLAELRGNVVLLEFWASWCLPCRKGVPFLDGLLARHEGGGLKVLAVTLEEETEAVMSFVSTHPGKFMVGRDPSGRAGEIFEVAAMPTSILLDREGRIVGRFEGGTESVHDQVEEAVGAAMRGETPATAGDGKRRRGPKGNLRAWERGYLADPIMNLNGDTLTRSIREHIHSSKEAAAGDGGVAGGGCGCN